MSDGIHIDSHDVPLPTVEVIKTISAMSRNKSDNLNFLFDWKKAIVPYLAKICNKLFYKNVYPMSWSNFFNCYKGDNLIIIVRNYKRIIFSLSLHNRLYNFRDNIVIFNEWQFVLEKSRQV